MLWAREAVVHVVAAHGDAPLVAELEDGASKVDADAHLLTGLRVGPVAVGVSVSLCLRLCLRQALAGMSVAPEAFGMLSPGGAARGLTL